MELYKEVMLRILIEDAAKIGAELVEARCYRAVQKIKAVIEDDSLCDVECFFKIEDIILALEELGSSCGGRHDFG